MLYQGDGMWKLAAVVVVLSTGILFSNPIEASAHGKDSHGGTVDAQMKKLHAMMPVFSVALAELESALEKGDTVKANAEAGKILAAIPDLKKSKPHKNVKQRKNFVEHATSFEEAVNSTVNFVKKDDFSGARAAFEKVEEACSACHFKFRD